MDAQELRNLQEAYMDVYDQEGVLDEVQIMRHQQLSADIDKLRSANKGAVKRGNKPPYKLKNENPAQMERMRRDEKRPPSRLRSGKLPENYDLYDIILSHLLDEGYAETPEAAEAIMVNMSEGWREDICEGYKKFPYKKVEDKIHKKEADSPTGRGTPQSVKMGKVFRHFKGEVRRTERREDSPKISKSKESENRARGTQKG